MSRKQMRKAREREKKRRARSIASVTWGGGCRSGLCPDLVLPGQ